MRLHFGPNRTVVVLPEGRRVSAEWLIERMQNRPEPKWIEVSGRLLRLRSEPEVWLACEIAVIEHNVRVGEDADDASDNEAAARETAEIEAQVQARLELYCSSDEDEGDAMDERDRPPTPSQDMVYEGVVYM